MTTTKPDSLQKREFLAHWHGIPANQPIRMSPVCYRHNGSTYDEDGIRITGSRRFVDSVLSRLKGLLDNENCDTRLQVVYKQSSDRETGALLDSWNCYIQTHERGHEARMVNHFASAITGKETIVTGV